MNKGTRTVSAREANQQFSQVLAAVKRGERVTITQYGVPVAVMTRISDMDGDAVEMRRRAAVEKAIALMRQGLPLGGPFTRDEMHDD